MNLNDSRSVGARKNSGADESAHSSRSAPPGRFELSLFTRELDRTKGQIASKLFVTFGAALAAYFHGSGIYEMAVDVDGPVFAEQHTLDIYGLAVAMHVWIVGVAFADLFRPFRLLFALLSLIGFVESVVLFAIGLISILSWEFLVLSPSMIPLLAYLLGYRLLLKSRKREVAGGNRRQ